MDPCWLLDFKCLTTHWVSFWIMSCSKTTCVVLRNVQEEGSNINYCKNFHSCMTLLNLIHSQMA